MQHVIFGAGLIGSYIGCAFIHAGLQVKFVARGQWRDRLAKVITLSDFNNHRATLKILNPLVEGGQKADIIWLTTKCTDVKASLNELRHYTHAETIIICCQNGIGTDALVKQAFPHLCVIRAIVPFNIVYREENCLHRGSEGSLTLESFPMQLMSVQNLILNVDSLLCPITKTNSMDALQWAKLQLNLGNSVNALANIPVKSMLKQRAYRKVIAMAMVELLTVVSRLGITMPKIAKVHGKFLPIILRLPNWMFNRVAKQMLAIDENVKTSMWWDLQARKLTEIDYLNGAVVSEGMRHGVRCPVNQYLIDLVKNVEEESRLTGSYIEVEAKTLLENLIKQLKKARTDARYI